MLIRKKEKDILVSVIVLFQSRVVRKVKIRVKKIENTKLEANIFIAHTHTHALTKKCKSIEVPSY